MELDSKKQISFWKWNKGLVSKGLGVAGILQPPKQNGGKGLGRRLGGSSRLVRPDAGGQDDVSSLANSKKLK